MTSNKCRGSRLAFTPLHCRRRGFTLLEMLVTLFAFSLVLLLGGALLMGGFRAEQTASAALQRLMVRSSLEDQLRTDIGQADGVIEQVGVWEDGGPSTLILHLPDGRQVIYLWKFLPSSKMGRTGTGHLVRCELPAEGGPARPAVPPQPMPLGSEVIGVTFTRAEVNPRLLVVRLTESLGAEKRTRLVEISAALGGDLR